MAIRAVIFDLDGTLLDTLQDITDSMNAVLDQFGCPNHEPEKYKYCIGDGIRDFVERALPENRRDDSTVTDGVEAMRREYDARLTDKSKPFPGIMELINEVECREIRMAVLSNKPDHLTQRIVSEILPSEKFIFVSGTHPEKPKKPDPTGALEIADLLNIPPAEILFLGDSAVDMQTATAAGMFPVGATWGFRTIEELKEGGARELIDEPLQMIRLLD